MIIEYSENFLSENFLKEAKQLSKKFLHILKKKNIKLFNFIQSLNTIQFINKQYLYKR